MQCEHSTTHYWEPLCLPKARAGLNSLCIIWKCFGDTIHNFSRFFSSFSPLAKLMLMCGRAYLEDHTWVDVFWRHNPLYS